MQNFTLTANILNFIFFYEVEEFTSFGIKAIWNFCPLKVSEILF